MSQKNTKVYEIFAPAKVNLFLHVTGRRRDGYHTLDSLVCFADIGDSVQIEPADSFSFHIEGPYAKSFGPAEKSTFLDSSNLAVVAARGLSQAANKAMNVKITLHKTLPLSSGLGGGSSDAAATLWGLQQFWGLAPSQPYMKPLMERLGADVSVCYACAPTIMRGIGDELHPAPLMPEIPIILINPDIHCSTRDVFLNHGRSYKKVIPVPDRFSSVFDLVAFLKATENDLYKPALGLVPRIDNVLNALNMQPECLLARMSGSGASCFGLFESEEHTKKALKILREENPDWWIKAGVLNRPERY